MAHRSYSRLLLPAAVVVVLGVFASGGGASVLATKPSNTSPPSVSGTAREGSTLTTSSGSWSGTTPMTFGYGWLRCNSNGDNCTRISNAGNSTYVLTSDDVGHTIRSQVTATNSAGATTASSSRTATVVGSTPPRETSAPSISGTAAVGETLKTSNGNWSGTSPISYKYDWRRCDQNGNGCSSISNHSDNQTYTLVDADLGHTVRAVVTATNSGGSAQAVTKPSAVVTVGPPVNASPPQVSGSTQLGQKLTGSNGTWRGNPTSYSYEWQRCDAGGHANCNIIPGATGSTYTTVSADLNHNIRIGVVAKNDGGSTTAFSPAVGPVVSATPSGLTKLPNGELSIAAANVPDSDRLTVAGIRYKPSVTSHNHQPLQATIHVVDEHGYDVAGALVYVLGTPYSWLAKVHEVPTGTNGRVTVTLTPTRAAPRRGSILLFIRARTPQGNLLAGSSTRRLVQFKLRP